MNTPQVIQPGKRLQRLLWAVACGLLLLIVSLISLAWMQNQALKQKASMATVNSQQLKAASERTLLMQSELLMEYARRENQKGNYDTALLLGLNAYPGSYGGERPLPRQREPLMTAVLKTNKTAVFELQGALSDVNFSPDGMRLLTIDENHSTLLWDIQSAKLLQTFSHRNSVRQATFSADGNWIVTSAADISVVWNTFTGKMKQFFPNSQPVKHSSFSPDGERIISILDDQTAAVWDIDTGKMLLKLAHDDSVYQNAISPDGQRFASSYSDGGSQIRDTQTGSKLNLSRSGWSRLPDVCFAFSGNSQRLATVALDGTTTLWDAHSGRDLNTFQIDGSFKIIATNSDGRWILTLSDSNTAILWDTATGKKAHTLVSDDVMEYAVFSPDNQWMVTASRNKAASVWSVETGKKVLIFQWEPGSPVKFSADSRKLVASTASNMATLMELKEDQKPETIQLPQNTLNSWLSTTGRWLVIASDNNGASLWNAQSGEMVHQLEQTGKVRFLEFSANDEQMLSVSQDNTAELWDAQTGTKQHAFKLPENTYWISLSPNAKLLFHASLNNNSTVLNTESGKTISGFPAESQFASAEFSTDDQYLITTSFTPSATLWSARTGEKLKEFTYESPPPNRLPDVMTNAIFSPDDEQVLTNSSNKTMVLWNVRTGEKQFALEADEHLHDAVFSPDGSWIFTGSVNAALLWSARTGEIVRSLENNDYVSQAAFSLNGKQLSILGGSRLYVWDVTPDLKGLYAAALQKLPLNRRCLSAKERQHFQLPPLSKNDKEARGCVDSALPVLNNSSSVNTSVLTAVSEHDLNTVKHLLSSPEGRYSGVLDGPMIWTYLMLTDPAKNDPTPMIKAIITALGTDHTDSEGWTPLMLAARFNRPQISKVLIEAGADTAITNEKGKTALDIAREQQNSGEIVRLLENSL